MAAHGIFKLNDTDLQLNDLEVIEDNVTFLNSSLSDKSFFDPTSYFGEYLKVYSNAYRAVHGYISFIICVFGIISNIMNITVLSRKKMVSSINAILARIAVADLLLMLSYLPYVYHYYIRDTSGKERYSYGWAVFTLFTVHCTDLNHAISTWLTVTVAVWRYIAIRFPLKGASWCSITRAKYAITATYVTCVVFHIPNYILCAVLETQNRDGETLYYVDFDLDLDFISRGHDRILINILLSIVSVFMKFLPCVALTALSFTLIRALNDAKQRRQILIHRAESDKSQTDHDRTTKMLLAVVLLFLLTMFPQGLIILLSVFLGTDFIINVLHNLEDTMVALALINSSVNFIIYCSMSSKFRDTFSLLFMPKCLHHQEIFPISKSPETSDDICRGESYKKREIF